MKTDGISTDQAARAAGLSYRQLDYWIRNGVVDPEQPADGCGTARRFAPCQVRALRLGAELNRLGAPAYEIIRPAIATATGLTDAEWHGPVVITDAGAIRFDLEVAHGWLVDLDELAVVA